MTRTTRTLLTATLVIALTASASIGDGISAVAALVNSDLGASSSPSTTDVSTSSSTAPSDGSGGAAGLAGSSGPTDSTPTSPVSTDSSTMASDTSTGSGAPELLGVSTAVGSGSTVGGTPTTTTATTTGPLDAHALLALDDQGWAQVTPDQLKAISDDDYRTLSKDDLIRLLERLHKMQEDALSGLLAGDSIPSEGDAGGEGSDDPAKVSALTASQLETTMSLSKLAAFQDYKFYGFTNAQRQSFATHLQDARDDLALKIKLGLNTDDNDHSDPDYDASWKTGRVDPNWRYILEHTDYNPWARPFTIDQTSQYRGQIWKNYLEENMPQGLDADARWEWVGKEVNRLNDINKISNLAGPDPDVQMRSIKQKLDAEAKQPSFWKKALDFLGCSLAFSLFDYVAFNAWPWRKPNGDVHWSYRALQTTVQLGLTLHLLKRDGPMTAMAFINNWGRFGDDYMFYIYGIIGKWLKVVPANSRWEGSFDYFQQLPDGSYRKAPWTTWVLRDGAHGFDKTNPSDIMNGPELLSNFTKGSWLTLHLLTLKDTPLKDTPFFQKYLSWLP